MTKKITAETLAADRSRRERERVKLADAYDRAADVLDQHYAEHREAVMLLRKEAQNWRRGSWTSGG
jgi:hypothetical protein